MPKVDGIELVIHIRSFKKGPVYILMITALTTPTAREHALESGADDFITIPIDINNLAERVSEGLSRTKQEIDKVIIKRRSVDISKPPFPAVAIAASTGGPPVLTKIFNMLDNKDAAYFIVQHGPHWMLETFVSRLQKESKLKINLGKDNDRIQPGNVYLAPGDVHMLINKRGPKIAIDNGPKQNFVRPAADPLFKTAAEAFGEYLLGVVLTGLGRDGAIGATQIKSSGGSLLIQDPNECIAPSMPNSVVNIGVDHTIKKQNDIPNFITREITKMKDKL